MINRNSPSILAWNPARQDEAKPGPLRQALPPASLFARRVRSPNWDGVEGFPRPIAVLWLALQNLLPLLHFFVKVRIVESRRFHANLIDSATVLSKLPVVPKSGFEFLQCAQNGI